METHENIDLKIQNCYQYDRSFLIACRNLQASKHYPEIIEEFPDLWIPITLPRIPSLASAKDGGSDEHLLHDEHHHGYTDELFSRPTGKPFTRHVSVEETICELETEDEETLNFDELLLDLPPVQKQDGGSAEKRDVEPDGSVVGQKSPQQELELNIPTDVDELGEIEDEDVSLRPYQQELAQIGSEGENVIVMAPTNTGKTRVACKIMQEHLRRQKRTRSIGKVVYLVENEALARQQGEEIGQHLSAYRTKFISGSIQRNKKQFLKDFVNRRDILVVTAQVLLNSLKLGEIPCLTTFSLIVFDECHHTNNLHSYNEIMSRYMDLKLRKKLNADKLPQVVGLTASLGVGGKTQIDQAMIHMKQVLANMDVKCLCTVRKCKENLAQYDKAPREEIATVQPRQNDLFRKCLLQIMDKIENFMISHPIMKNLDKRDAFIVPLCRVPDNSCRGTSKFLQWLSGFRRGIARLRTVSLIQLLNPCMLHLEAYNKALQIHADARTKEALAILHEFMEDELLLPEKFESVLMLQKLYKGLLEKDFSQEPENPKLVKLKEIIESVHSGNENARGIIFVDTKELARSLNTWMHDTEPLKALNSSILVGQVAPAFKGGMSRGSQTDVIEYFKEGHHKIVIATSVAEEGLNIEKCNLVVCYEHVTNEIVRLQTRGRARAENSRYYVLTEEGSWIVEKAEKNKELEQVMNIVVEKLQNEIGRNPNQWEEESLHIQELKKLQEEIKENARLAKIRDDDMEMQCIHCAYFICMSSDLRKVEDSHHIILNQNVHRRLLSRRFPKPQFVDVENFVERNGRIYCGNLDCVRPLGTMFIYRRVDFPLISKNKLRVIGKDVLDPTFKKWKDVPFEIKPLTLDDLKIVVRQRRALL